MVMMEGVLAEYALHGPLTKDNDVSRVRRGTVDPGLAVRWITVVAT
jgi:hypothetical protein